MGRRKEKREARETRETTKMMETRERSVTFQQIDQVKNMIEHCLMLYMNMKQTVETLLKEQKVERALTETVWQRLQQDNPDFFTEYNVRLLLKEQITVFNMLLGKQANDMGFPRKSVCGNCGTALVHSWKAPFVHCAKCSEIFSVPPQGKVSEHATGHASTSLAAQCMPSNANPLSAMKYGGSSGNPNIQVGAGDLFPAERMGVPGKILDHVTGHASTSLAAQYRPSNANPLSAIKYSGSSGNPNIQVGAGDSFPAERMGIPGKIPDHVTGHASNSLAAQYMPSNANPLSANKYGGSSGNPNIQVGAGVSFPAERMGIPRKILDHATGHASTSLAAQHTTSNANPLSAIKYGGSSGNPNIRVGAGDLFPAERMGIPMRISDHATGRASTSIMPSNANPLSAIKYCGSSGISNIQVGAGDLFPAERIPDHATGQASTSLAAQYMPSNANPLSAIKYGESSGNPNIQVGAGDLFPAERMAIPGKILEHSTGHASTYLSAEYVPSNANPLSAIKYGASSGHPKIHVGADAMFPAGRSCISTDILETETSRTQISHEVTGTANKSGPSFMRNSGSGGDDLLAMHSSTGDADGASSHQFEMSGKPFPELPLDADTSFNFSVPEDLAEDLAELLPDIDEHFFGLSDCNLDKLVESLFKDNTDQSEAADQIPELSSPFDLKSDEHAPPSSGAGSVSSSIIPGGFSGHQRIQEDGNASVPADRLSISTSMLATKNSNTGPVPQVIG